MLTLERATSKPVDTRFPEPLVLPWSELPVLGLDGETPWLYGPIERDPLATTRGRTVLPRREIRRLRALASSDLPFQRLAIAHELDPAGPVRDLLPELTDGPRTCTDAVARAVVGRQPMHPTVRATARVLDALVGCAAAVVSDAVLDPVIFGVVGMPDLTHGRPAVFHPVSAWTW